MRQSLQQKFNLLAVVLLLFCFLMLPIFSQVKADTRDSVKSWRDTLSYKVWKDVKASWINKDKLNDLDIEEVDPDEWSRQAKEANPNCGSACDPDGDVDGDNVTNADEYRNSKDPNCNNHCNPSCNEDQYGVDYCKQQSQTQPPVDPPKNVTRTTVKLVKELWFNTTNPGQNCPSLQGVCTVPSLMIAENFTELRFFFNGTSVRAVQWDLATQHDQGAGSPFVTQPSGSFGGAANPTYVGIEEEPKQGTYRFDLSYTGLQSGRWTMQVYGVIVT